MAELTGQERVMKMFKKEPLDRISVLIAPHVKFEYVLTW